MEINHIHLEYLTDIFLKQQTQENEEKMVNECVHLLMEDASFFIDGSVLEDGSIDPAHLFVDIDQRYYFHVYTSKHALETCHVSNPYVLPLKTLLEAIFEEDTFGGITMNYVKGKEVVLISKEIILKYMQKFLKENA